MKAMRMSLAGNVPESTEAQKRVINQCSNLINLLQSLKEASLAKVELDDKGDLRPLNN